MELPEARLRPNGRADHVALVRMRAAKVGRAAVATGKTLLTLVVCSGGLVLVGLAGGQRSPHYNFKPDSLERIQHDLRVLESMPKVDFKPYQYRLSSDAFHYRASQSPSERAATSRP